MKKSFILTFSLMLLLASCSKKTTVTTPNREDALRTGKWMIESGTITVKLPDGRDTILNYMNFLPACHKDDYLVFHTGVDAALHSGSNICSPSDPDSITFKWGFNSTQKNLSLYHGFDFIYAVSEHILPFVFDTCMDNGIWGLPYLYPGVTLCNPLAVDTLHGVNDTLAGYTRMVVVLDTFWNLKFDSLALDNTDIYNANVINFSQSSFTINFNVYGTYPDSTQHHTNKFVYIDGITGLPVTLDNDPIIKKDTFKYQLTYRNF